MTDPREPLAPSSKRERKRALESKASKVRCIRCGALAGQPCQTDDGAPSRTSHRERIRAAGYLPITDAR